ncbi:MAG: hypothetical protein NTV48_01850 [Candidatus Vogelbacteria bacterium]|nr:hypothetical protein [Candidatus Vogelbacteria bacterium]
MKIFKDVTFSVWQMAIFKIAVGAVGIAIGAYWSAIFLPYLAYLVAIWLVLGIYILHVWLKK